MSSTACIEVVGSFRSVRRSRRGASGLVLALLLGACVSPRYVPLAPVAKVPTPTALSPDVTFAPAADPIAELEQLPKNGQAPLLLRRAFLELQCGRPEAAIDTTSIVLYGPSRPAANEEAFARYLRASAYVRRGTPSLARFDADRARSLSLDPALQRLLAALPMTAEPATSSHSLAALAVKSRAAWHAAAPNTRNLDPMDRATRLTVHHSAVYFRDNAAESAAVQIQHIQREHMHERDYGDIGYHFLIDPAGRVWQGRDLHYQGAHASGSNNVRNIGICVLGNFVRGAGGQGPTPEQVTSLRGLIDALMRDYGFGPDAIYCHSDFKATECPGPLLESVVARLSREMSGKLAAE